VKTTRPTRIAITSGAAVLCLGVAAPSVAYACTGGDTSSAAHPATAAAQQLSAPTLQQEQAWIDSFVAHRSAWLDRLSAVVSADPQLTADQQAQALDSIAKAKAALTDLQSAVDAATSTDQVHSIVKAALEAMPMPWWPHPLTHRDGLKHHSGYEHHAVEHHAFEHHARTAMRRDEQASATAPTDVQVRPADSHTVRYAAFTRSRARHDHHDFGAQHWSHPGDRFASRGGHHWDGGHRGFRGGHDSGLGGWGH
jgi:hypothetical protein